MDRADELRRMKFKLREVGRVERLVPMTEVLVEHGRPATEKETRNHVGLADVLIYEFDLPLVK
jgi:hypothetical protein